MSSMFIRVDADASIYSNTELAKKLTDICPVDIFAQNGDGTLRIVEENLDECVLCDLCVEACPPGAIKVVKLYEQ